MTKKRKKVVDKTELKIRRYIDDLQRRLIEGSLSFDSFKKVVGPLIGQYPNEMPVRTYHLEFVGMAVIPATKSSNGMDPENPFPFDYISDDFDNQNQTVSMDTKEVSAFVYKQINFGTIVKIFRSFERDLDLISFETHEQIKKFVEQRRGLLHPKNHQGFYTHFLFKNLDEEYCVAVVEYLSRDESLEIDIIDFNDDEILDPDFEHRFVVLAR